MINFGKHETPKVNYFEINNFFGVVIQTPDAETISVN